MLPDFASLKTRFIEKVSEAMRDCVNSEPFLSGIKHIRHFEGDRFCSVSIDGNVRDSKYKESSSNLLLRHDELIEKGYPLYIEKSLEVAKDLQGQKARHVFKTIEEVTNKTGNVVDSKGQPFGPEVLLSALEQIQIDFNDDGTPRMPSFVTHPKFWEKVKPKLAEWNSNPEYIRRHAEIIERKRKEWHDRESNRKLVD